MTGPLVPPRFKPAPYATQLPLRVDEPSGIEHVIAVVSVPEQGGRRELVIGIDAGHVIRVIPMTRARELPPRAVAELEYHAQQGAALRVETAELYLFDVQVIEHVPDVPGADDPIYLYGVLRGPYPGGVEVGTAGIEGQLASARSGVLDGFAMGVERAFRYVPSPYGSRCVPLVLAGADLEATAAGRAIVLAFSLAPPLGREHAVANDLVAAQLVHDVIGATRRDLGDDLGEDPVPVPSRDAYERELARGGWVIKADVAKRKVKGRFASLFTPAETQRLPAEATLPQFAALVAPLLYRLQTQPRDQQALHARVPAPIRQRPPTGPLAAAPPPPPTPARPAGRSTTPPASPPPIAKRPRMRPPTNPSPIDFLGWVAELVDDHAEPDRRPRASQPSRVVEPPHSTAALETRLQQWLFDLSESDRALAPKQGPEPAGPAQRPKRRHKP